jgi:hypothetical protein
VPGETTEALCVRVGAVFDDYCDGLLDGLRNAVLPVDAADAGWVRDHYVPQLLEFATSLRDAIADRTARHAAAQSIQCKVLEHERNLRFLLDSPMAPAPAAELASATPANPDTSHPRHRPAKN